METTHQKSSPRDVFLYLLAIIMLYVSVWGFISLWFDYVDVLFPDQLFYFGNASWNSIRMSMATLIIVFPVYLGVTWFLRSDVIKFPEKHELRVRKWLLNLTLFLAAVTIIVDLVMLVNNFLNGDLTTRFFLKVIVVLVTAGAVFGYYFWDLRRQTTAHSRPSRLLVILAALFVFGSIAGGFFIVGSPTTQRLRRFDDQRLMDLQNIQWQVIDFWQRKRHLPEILDALKNNLTGNVIPLDPETAQPYGYRVIASRKFELCATFNLPTLGTTGGKVPSYAYPVPYGEQNQTWKHEKGRGCFVRVIDPTMYPKAAVMSPSAY